MSRKKKGTTVLFKVTKRTELAQITQLSLSPFADDYLVVHCSCVDVFVPFVCVFMWVSVCVLCRFSTVAALHFF